MTAEDFALEQPNGSALMAELELTAEEKARLAEMVADLHAHGYRVIAEHNGLRVGARVRHRGDQWPQAYDKGTGFVAALAEKPDSAWSRSYRMPDVEMVVVRDKPVFEDWSRLTQLAQYHVEVIEAISNG